MEVAGAKTLVFWDVKFVEIKINETFSINSESDWNLAWKPMKTSPQPGFLGFQSGI